MKIFFRKNGFTLVELLIVIAIFAVTITTVLYSFSGYRNTQSLNNTQNDIVAMLNQARSKTLAGEGGVVYGVHFESARAVLFSGSSFVDGNSSNIVYTFDPSIKETSMTVNGGGGEIFFKKLSGNTDQFGTIVLQANNSSSNQKTITINKLGTISYN